MPTSAHDSKAPVAVVLIAHQDDETGVYHKIISHIEQGHSVVCACFTRGVIGDLNPSQRDAETVAVLGDMGVPQDNVIFAGTLLSIDDQALVDNMTIAADWLREWLGSFESICAVYTTALEGGHPDHDSLHVISAEVCNQLGVLDKLKQYSLYHGHNVPWQFFRVASPLAANGPVTRSRLPWKQRCKFLVYSFWYVSQRKSWLGLFPFFLCHYFLIGTQQLQPVSMTRLSEKPHDGSLYYESRSFASWEYVSRRVDEFRSMQESV